MVFHPSLQRLWPLVKERALKPMDVCVLTYFLSHMDVATSRVEVTTGQAAEELGIGAHNVSGCLKRLRTAQLIAKARKGSNYYWMLSPHVWHAGGYPKFGMRQSQWEALLEADS
jgi:hypothetical protein